MTTLARADERFTILAVDNDPAIRTMLAQLLRSDQCSVAQAAHPADLLTLLATLPCIAVVLTLPDFPERQGVELVMSLIEADPLPVHTLTREQAGQLHLLCHVCPNRISISAPDLAQTLRDEVLQTLSAHRHIDRTRAHQYADVETSAAGME